MVDKRCLGGYETRVLPEKKAWYCSCALKLGTQVTLNSLVFGYENRWMVDGVIRR